MEGIADSQKRIPIENDILDHIPSLICVVSEDFRISYTNVCFQRMVGKHNLQGLSFIDHILEEDVFYREKFRDRVQSVFKDPSAGQNNKSQADINIHTFGAEKKGKINHLQ